MTEIMQQSDLEPDGAGAASGSQVKDAVLRGGAAYATREIAGLLLSIVSTVVVLRILGPQEYGYVGLGIGLSSYLSTLGPLGLNVYLVRAESLDEDTLRSITALVLASAVVIGGSLALAAPVIAHAGGFEGATTLIRIVAFSVALKITSSVPVARLERDLEFRTVAGAEFASLGVYYVALFPAVLMGAGALGVWGANLVQTMAYLALLLRARPCVPGVRGLRAAAPRALRFGVAYQASSWVYSLRDLAAPVLLARLVGVDALGIVTAATQIIQRIGFFRMVVWRISMSALSRVQADLGLMRKAVERGMLYQAVLLGGVLAGFASVSPWLVPLLLGSEWDAAARLVPVLAAAALVSGEFTLHSSALVVRGDLKGLTVYHALHVALIWGATAALAPMLGVWGYGLAEVAAWGSYIYLAWRTSHEIGAIRYARVAIVLIPLLAVCGITLLVPEWAALASWACVVAVLTAVSPQVRDILREGAHLVRRRRAAA